MIRISNISFFRFCWENGKLDWPKCARTEDDLLAKNIARTAIIQLDGQRLLFGVYLQN